jgi:hypothetical protein
MAASQIENIHSAYWFWNKRNIEIQKGIENSDLESGVRNRHFERVQELIKDIQGSSVIHFMSRVLEYNQVDIHEYIYVCMDK